MLVLLDVQVALCAKQAETSPWVQPAFQQATRVESLNQNLHSRLLASGVTLRAFKQDAEFTLVTDHARRLGERTHQSPAHWAKLVAVALDYLAYETVPCLSASWTFAFSAWVSDHSLSSDYHKKHRWGSLPRLLAALHRQTMNRQLRLRSCSFACEQFVDYAHTETASQHSACKVVLRIFVIVDGDVSAQE